MFEDWLKRTGKWMEGTGPFPEIAVSSRIRLARNLEGQPFITRATPAQSLAVMETMTKAFSQVAQLKEAGVWAMDELSGLDRHLLVERHVISHELAGTAPPAPQVPGALRVAEQARVGRGVVIDMEERISLMMNEEDHLRLQVIHSGLDLEGAWEVAAKIDRTLSEMLTYAFSSSWGYLACCPTNTGTGLRASVMLHLPALVFERRAEKVLRKASQLGLAVRGLYGEGSEVKSVFFQVSNQVTLGKTETEIIEHVAHVTRQLIQAEQETRQSLMKNQRIKIEDSVWRAYALLKHARTVTSVEATDLLSTVRLGVELGLIKDVSIRTLNELLMLAQPAHMQKRLGQEVSGGVRDEKRAEFFRERLQ